MTPSQIDEVWSMLDRDLLRDVARRGPEPVFATISGAHLYGFASPDSDVDLRGAFLLPARALLGLHPPDETLTIEDKTKIDLDWVAHDIRKFARLMTNHNGYVLEQLYSPRVRAVATHALQLPAETVGALNAERRYRASMKHWEAYQAWKAERNPARAELERRHGYDTKHAMHLVRLMRTGLELLETGELRVRRADAPELNAVRDGTMTFEELQSVASELQGSMVEAAKGTLLPANVDQAFVEEVALAMVRERRD